MLDQLHNLAHDLRLALRQLLRSRTFSVTVVLTLAVGIGLNAAIFTMVDCVLLRPLGYHDAARIYGIGTHVVSENRSTARIGGDDFSDAASQLDSLEYAAYYANFKDGLQTGGRTLYTEIGYVSPEFGQVMGVEPIAGRLFHITGHAKDNITHPEEAMVSNAFARDTFGSAQNALGKQITNSGLPRVIVGVLPDGFTFPGNSAVWIEAPSKPEIANRTAYNQQAIAKARPGVTPEQLQAEMATFSKRLQTSYTEDKDKTIEAVPLQEQIVGKIKPVLRLLMAAVAVVLLIVCANITHLQLVRGTQTRRETTIRTALGASRITLARRAAIEVLLLALAGCTLGVLIAQPALKLLTRMAPPDVPRLNDIHLNLTVVGVSFLVSLAAMAVTALLPLWRSWQLDPASAMKQDASRGTESRSSGRLRQGLVVAEVALTLTLSVAAVLLVKQMIAESQADLGFTSDKLVLLDTHSTSKMVPLMMALPQNAPPTHDQTAQLMKAAGEDVAGLDSMLEAIRAVPGVASADAVYGPPMHPSGSDVDYAVKGVSTLVQGARLPDANVVGMTPGYLSTMGIPLRSGRTFTAADRLGSEMVLLISESMARQSFRGQDPIGKQIMCGLDMQLGWWTIVGVVGDIRQDSPATEPTPTLYVPIAQHPQFAQQVNIVARTHGTDDAMAATLSRFMKQQYPQVAVKESTMHADMGESERAQHFRTLLFSSFAAVSILLAITGMYGVTAYTVAQKRFEFALRFALGAQRSTVLGGVLRSALIVSTLGIGLGVALSLLVKQALSTLLGQQPNADLAAFAIAGAGVLFVAILAALQPAIRAARVEPMQVLRSE